MTNYKMQRFNGKSKTWEDIDTAHAVLDVCEAVQSLEVDVKFAIKDLRESVLALTNAVCQLKQENETQRIKMLRMANAIANQLPNRNKFFADCLCDDDSPINPPLP
jgi:hypothetical protein